MSVKTVQILKRLSTGLVVVAMVFAFLIAGIRIFGVQVYGVLTGSMEPTYPTGSLIYVRRVDASDLRVNDVITFSISPSVIATHRIVEIVPDAANPSVVQYRTKGDANNDVDAGLVSASNIIGKVIFCVPQMGYIANFIQSSPGIYVAILVCGLMIAFVFYTDSLESKMKASARRGTRRAYPQQRPRQPVQQRPYARQGDYPRQRPYPQQREYPRQGEYSRPRYQGEGEPARQSRYQREDEYPRQSRYPSDGAYPRQREYPPRRTYPQQREASQPREYSRQYDDRTGRM